MIWQNAGLREQLRPEMKDQAKGIKELSADAACYRNKITDRNTNGN